MAKYVKGIDISHWEPEIDWARLREQDIHFVFIKATQGTAADPLFPTLWAGAKQAGMLRGAYHFIDPRIDGAAQARTFLETVKDFEPGDLPPVLDLEDLEPKFEGEPEGKGRKGVKASPAKGRKGKKSTPRMIDPGTKHILPLQIVACARAWLDRVEEASKRTPILYSRGEYLTHRMQVNRKPPTWSMSYPMWIAHYFPLPINEDLLPAEAAGWPPFLFWQYSEDGLLDGVYNQGRIQKAEVDLNFFRGSVEELYRFAGAPVPAQGFEQVPQGEMQRHTESDTGAPSPVVEPVERPAPGPVAPLPVEQPVAGSPATYCIEPRDTLFAIARRFNTSVEAILRANPQIANPNFIRAGDTINIPA